MSDCIFCKIVNKEIPSEVLYEDDQILAFKDINPVAPVHILVIPKKHIISVNDIIDEDSGVIGNIFIVIKKLALQQGVAETGYRVITNVGRDGGQEVAHLHFHLIGGKELGKKIG
ncbi:MAG: histidine triad nucleotide-binding protein [Peptococcaceae bacterium]|jgi:histidine triad (HIT) family protein|nr:histidine triad nucleotide-binding protein [Peptococcaceae bacterium]